MACVVDHTDTDRSGNPAMRPGTGAHGGLIATRGALAAAGRRIRLSMGAKTVSTDLPRRSATDCQKC